MGVKRKSDPRHTQGSTAEKARKAQKAPRKKKPEKLELMNEIAARSQSGMWTNGEIARDLGITLRYVNTLKSHPHYLQLERQYQDTVNALRVCREKDLYLLTKEAMGVLKEELAIKPGDDSYDPVRRLGVAKNVLDRFGLVQEKKSEGSANQIQIGISIPQQRQEQIAEMHLKEFSLDYEPDSEPVEEPSEAK